MSLWKDLSNCAGNKESILAYHAIFTIFTDFLNNYLSNLFVYTDQINLIYSTILI